MPAPVNPQPEQPLASVTNVAAAPSSAIEATAEQACEASTVTFYAEAPCSTVTITETAYVAAYPYVLPFGPGPVVWTNASEIPVPTQPGGAIPAPPMVTAPPAVTDVDAEHTEMPPAPCTSS
ncbi:hypothetical protein IWW55_004314 [Coemansia sp. RSA 2706]|nr:hypothetical protein IWW55_004314 [Coemansia sp. RSA 2706]